MNPLYELRITGSADVDRAVWHRHGGEGDHYHTAEDYRRHEPIDDEVIVTPPPEEG